MIFYCVSKKSCSNHADGPWVPLEGITLQIYLQWYKITDSHRIIRYNCKIQESHKRPYTGSGSVKNIPSKQRNTMSLEKRIMKSPINWDSTRAYCCREKSTLVNVILLCLWFVQKKLKHCKYTKKDLRTQLPTEEFLMVKGRIIWSI